MAHQTELHITQSLFDESSERFLETSLQDEATNAAHTVLTLARCAIDFATIERVPRYTPERRENDAEHSFMLAMVAPELAYQYFPSLNDGLVAQFSIVHDLIELETDDVATFGLDEAGLLLKEATEMAALGALADRLPRRTRELLMRYEAQREPEARFVRLVDKALPVAVDLLGPGRQVMVEDYAVTTRSGLDATEATMSTRLKSWFPETELTFLHMVRDTLAEYFSVSFE